MSVSIEKAIIHLEKGGIVIYPTDTLWGMGCNAFDENAVEKLIKIKGKIEEGMSVVIPTVNNAKMICNITKDDENIISNNVPGPFTFILRAKTEFPKGVCRNGRLGIRIPENLTAIRLSEKFPIISTSANKHGEKTAEDIEEATKIFGDEVLYLNGEEPMGIQSTVINLNHGEVEVIRQGVGHLKKNRSEK